LSLEVEVHFASDGSIVAIEVDNLAVIEFDFDEGLIELIYLIELIDEQIVLVEVAVVIAEREALAVRNREGLAALATAPQDLEDQQRPRRRDGEGAAWIGLILTDAAAS
jgi:hypothetical protein